jgi:Family of unknown function (DUF6152)
MRSVHSRRSKDMTPLTKTIRLFVGIVLLLSVVFSGTLAAHHSFAAEFDVNKPVKVTGKVTQMRWSNPHGWLYLEVTGPDGKTVNWAFELNSTNALIRQGWKKEDLPVGIVLVIDGYQARNGQTVANATSVTFSDGRKLLAGSPVTTPQQ